MVGEVESDPEVWGNDQSVSKKIDVVRLWIYGSEQPDISIEFSETITKENYMSVILKLLGEKVRGYKWKIRLKLKLWNLENW